MPAPATVLALHGGGLDPRNWDAVRGEAPELKFVAPFLPDIASGAADCPDFVGRLAALIPEGPVVVTGVSIGCRIAVEVAEALGPRAQGVLLIGPGPVREDEAFIAKIRGLRSFLVDAFQPESVETMIPVMVHRFGKRYAEAHAKLHAMLHASAGARAAPLVRVTEPMSWAHEPLIRKLTVPIHVLYGRHDAVIEPQWATEWRSVPHASVEWVVDAAHNIALENPELVARYLRRLCVLR